VYLVRVLPPITIWRPQSRAVLLLPSTANDGRSTGSSWASAITSAPSLRCDSMHLAPSVKFTPQSCATTAVLDPSGVCGVKLAMLSRCLLQTFPERPRKVLLIQDSITPPAWDQGYILALGRASNMQVRARMRLLARGPGQDRGR